MTTLNTDPGLEAQLIAERQAAGADRFDEVWEGIYVMNPLPNIEHQELAANLCSCLSSVVTWQRLGQVYPGVNVSDRVDGWEHNYRAPDVAVYLTSTSAKRCVTHWCGGPDLAIEITSPGDRSREKIDFYARVNTRELLIVDRDPWLLELFRLADGTLKAVGKITPGDSDSLSLDSVPLILRLIAPSSTGATTARPRIEVRHAATAEIWLV